MRQSFVAEQRRKAVFVRLAVAPALASARAGGHYNLSPFILLFFSEAGSVAKTRLAFGEVRRKIQWHIFDPNFAKS